MKQSVSIALIVLAGIAVAAFITESPETRSAIFGDQTSYVKISDFSTSSTDAEISKRLLDAFSSRRLVTLWSGDIPGGGKLVYAGPTTDGAPKNATCGDKAEYCAMFVTRSGADRLLVRGGRLAGFQGVERFEGRTAIIAIGFRLYEYTDFERDTLNIDTGEIVPRIVFETDSGDMEARFTVTVPGEDALMLDIPGNREKGRFIPSSVTFQKDNGAALLKFPQAVVDDFAARSRNATAYMNPIQVVPSDADTKTSSATVNLFGVPYVIDVKAKTVTKIGESVKP